MKRFTVGTAFALIVGLLVSPRALEGQILQVAELNSQQLRSLDRSKTVVLLPGAFSRSTDPICLPTATATSTNG